MMLNSRLPALLMVLTCIGWYTYVAYSYFSCFVCLLNALQ
jgi:hypothetical protein